MTLRLSLISALIGIAICASGVSRVRLHASQIQARADTSNATQNAIDFLLSLNHTLIKYDSDPLITLPGVSDAAGGDAKQESQLGPDTVETRSTDADPLSHVVSKRVALPAAVVSMPFVSHNVLLRLGPSRAGSWMADIPTVFDTGARVYSVPSVRCDESRGCIGDIKYPESGRDTGYDNDQGFLSIPFVRGRDFTDNVIVGERIARGITVQSIRGGDGLLATTTNTTAILGLGRKADPGQTTFWQALVRDNVLEKNEFSFYFGRSLDGTAADSEMMLGGRDPDHFEGRPITVPLNAPHLQDWTVQIDHVAGPDNKKATKSSLGNALIDTGCTGLLFPPDVVDALIPLISTDSIALEIPRQKSGNYHVHLVPCTTEIDISINMAGTRFRLDPRDMKSGPINAHFMEIFGLQAPEALEQETRDMCMVQIFGAKVGRRAFGIGRRKPYGMILGQPLLKSYYATFGENDITFAKSRPRAGGTVAAA